MNIIVITLIYYGGLLALFFISSILAANEGWKRRGLIQSMDEARKTADEMEKSNHWTFQFLSIMYAITFFYYCIPVSAYYRFVRHDKTATLIHPRGKKHER